LVLMATAAELVLMATAAELVLAGADVAALSKVVELALFYDASSCSHENANEVRPLSGHLLGLRNA
jgi:hypothetical protein